MKKQEVLERITRQLTFELGATSEEGSKELKEDIAKTFLNRKIAHLVSIVTQINQIQKNKGDKKDIPKLQDVDPIVFYLMDIMAVIEPLDKLDLKHLKGNSYVSIYDLYSMFPDSLSPVSSASEFLSSNIYDIGTSVTKSFLTSKNNISSEQMSKSLTDAKDWVFASIPSWFLYTLQSADSILKSGVSESEELSKILDEDTVFGRSREDRLNELRKINEEGNKAKSFLEDLYARNTDLMSDIKNVKIVLSKLACGLMVIRDEVISKKQSTLKLEELKNKITDLANEIVKGDKKYLSPLTRTKIFFKEMNPLTELGTGLGLVDYYKNMSTSAKLTSATLAASAGLLISAIAVPVSFVALSFSVVSAGITISMTTLKSAYQSSVVDIKDTTVKVRDIYGKGVDFIESVISRDKVIELSTFSKDEKYYVRDVESFIYYAFLGKSELEKTVFKGLIEDTFIKGSASKKYRDSVQKSLEKLFADCTEHVEKGNDINDIIVDIDKFMKSIEHNLQKSKKKNGIFSQMHSKSSTEGLEKLFEELCERVKRAKNDSHSHNEVSKVLEDASIDVFKKQRNIGV